eukprot:2811561-Rhodomonas_salina.1
MDLARALNEFAQFCIGKCHVAAGHSDQERKMTRDAAIASMKGRVSVELGVLFGIDGLSESDCALDAVTDEFATKIGGDFSL